MTNRFMTEAVRVGRDRECALRVPQLAADVAQNEEWFELQVRGKWERFRLHDYETIYSVPGLYEALIYRVLRCRSPERVARVLRQTREDLGEDREPLRVLDLGAGNGIVAEELSKAGAQTVLGVDIIEEARIAARRDRPDVYDDYLVADLTRLSVREQERLRAARLNCLVSVAALGFGDVPPRAFATALDLIDVGGWAAFAIKEDFLDSDDPSGFARLIRDLHQRGVLRVDARHRYWHRLSLAGERIVYVILVARKLTAIPPDLLAALPRSTMHTASSGLSDPIKN